MNDVSSEARAAPLSERAAPVDLTNRGFGVEALNSPRPSI
jgi:hypothetical protein